MAEYDVIDNETGEAYIITADKPPTQAEARQAIAYIKHQQQQAQVKPEQEVAPELPELLPELLRPGSTFTDGLDANPLQYAALYAGAAMTRPDELAKILKHQFGNKISIKYSRVGDSDDLQINVTNRSTGETVALNRPGISPTDVIQGLGLAASMVVPGGAAAGVGARLALAGGVSAARELSHAAMGGDFDLDEIATDTMLAGAGELVGKGIDLARNKQVRRLTTLKDHRLSEEGIREAEDAAIQHGIRKEIIATREGITGIIRDDDILEAKRLIEKRSLEDKGLAVKLTDEQLKNEIQKIAIEQASQYLPQYLKSKTNREVSVAVADLIKSLRDKPKQQVSKMIGTTATDFLFTGGLATGAGALYTMKGAIDKAKQLRRFKDVPDDKVWDKFLKLKDSNPELYESLMADGMKNFMKNIRKGVNRYKQDLKKVEKQDELLDMLNSRALDIAEPAARTSGYVGAALLDVEDIDDNSVDKSIGNISGSGLVGM